MDSTVEFILTGGRGSRIGRDRRLMERPLEHVRLPEGSVGYWRAVRAAELVIKHKCLKMHALIKSLWAVPWPVAGLSPLEKLNTLDWATR